VESFVKRTPIASIENMRELWPDESNNTMRGQSLVDSALPIVIDAQNSAETNRESASTHTDSESIAANWRIAENWTFEISIT